MGDEIAFAVWCAVWCIGLTWASAVARRDADRSAPRRCKGVRLR